MAQAIDRQGLDTLFVKARSLRKWVAGAEMVKVREGADPDWAPSSPVRRRSGRRLWARTTRRFERRFERRSGRTDGGS